MAQRPSITDLPNEVLDQILSYFYPPWSLYILDRNARGTLCCDHNNIHGTLPIDGLPRTALPLVAKHFASLTPKHERSSFTGCLIFTTASTQWRILARLRASSPTRLGWILDHVTTLVFCSPPLFTCRIPWSSLPSLKRVELDYCYRAANFRCQGTARELEGGYLDPMIVNFARDTERFDLPLVEDAWRVTTNRESLSSSLASNATSSAGSSDAGVASGMGGRRIEVLVIKRMIVFESPPLFNLPRPNERVSQRLENWKIKVTATHRGQIEDVRFQITDGSYEPPFGEAVVWTATDGFRDTIPFEDIPKRQLKVKDNSERRRYLVALDTE